MTAPAECLQAGRVGDPSSAFITTPVLPGEAPSVYRGRRTYGAVAYLKADEAADVYAERQGLYVIRATGSSASITNEKNFRPRTFGA